MAVSTGRLARATAIVLGGALVGASCSNAGPEARRRPEPNATVVAVARSRHVSLQRAKWLLQRQQTLAVKDARVRSAARPDTFGGSWVDLRTGKLVVATTEHGTQLADADTEPKVVARSLTELRRAKSKVDLLVRRDRPDGVSWGIDEPHNVVGVQVPRPELAKPGTARFAREVRDLGPAVRVVSTAAAPRESAGIQDGDQITPLLVNQAGNCSVGWWVKDGSGADLLMTAGHCLRLGNDGGRWHWNGLIVGGDVKSEFGPTDWGLIHVDSYAAPRPTTQVSLGNGTFAKISGMRQAAIGSIVCKTGATTGQTCGRVTGYDASYTSEGAKLEGMATANLCQHPGDSGAPVYQFDPGEEGHVQAQGILDAGTCVDSDKGQAVMYYTPIDTALASSDTTLVTSTD